MRLRELSPQFLKVVAPGRYDHVDTVEDADGVLFLCPVCFEANGGQTGTHSILCWQPRVPQSVPPTPGRWAFEGKGYDDLTLRAGSSSILLTSGCKAHFWIERGAIRL